jgi:DNA polymerase elongation subunit (family B)
MSYRIEYEIGDSDPVYTRDVRGVKNMEDIIKDLIEHIHSVSGDVVVIYKNGRYWL